MFDQLEAGFMQGNQTFLQLFSRKQHLCDTSPVIIS